MNSISNSKQSHKKYRSFIELKDFPMDQLKGQMDLASILEATKYAEISEDEKQEVIILKESFIFLDKKLRRVGVFTRSDKDHGSKIGECSTLLSGNFDKTHCTVTNDGAILYNIKSRLDNYVREISSIFNEPARKKIPTIYFHDRERNKRYIFLIFELSCDSKEMPLCYRLDNRTEDLFIGMRDVADIARGVNKYNRSEFQIDKFLVRIFSEKAGLPWFNGKFSVIDKLVDLKMADFTLVKFDVTFNLIKVL